MRPLETVLLLGVPGLWLGVRRATGRPAVVVVMALLAVAVLAHVVAESPRWQLTAVYGAAVVVAASAVRRLRSSEHVPGRVGGAVVVVAAMVAAVLAWALPIPVLPAPSGSAPVGTTVVAITDTDRVERYGDAPSGPRRLVAQVWYPASPRAPRAPGPWVDQGPALGRAAADWLGLPPFALDHIGLVRGTATPDAAPVEADDLPVVVYVHGWGGFRSVQADLVESLASEGYVVAALDHTHGAVATRFPDGEVVPIDPSALPEGVPAERYDAAAAELVTTFADDLGVLLDELRDGAVPALTGRLDLDRVAFVGHSTGGGAAVARCATDTRCAAVVGLDPWVEPVADATIGAGLDTPLLSIRSEAWTGDANDARLRRLHAASSSATGLLSIDGTDHRDVTVLPFLSPLASRLGLSGPTPADRTHEIVASWTVHFLDHTLRAQRTDALPSPPRFPEVTVDELGSPDPAP